MFDDDSQSTIQSNSDNWITLEENISKVEIDEFIRTQMPISTSYQTNRVTYCTFCDDILQRHNVNPYFLEYGICKHFISLCKLLNLQFDENDREFVQVKKRVKCYFIKLKNFTLNVIQDSKYNFDACV
ncbi:hypothetical protein BpHYR1_030357, partial [Brachionus plicatilis]